MSAPLTTAPLYAIADAREILDRLIDENDGVLTPELEAALDGLDGSFNEKAERCALWIREQMAQADMIKGEEDRLAKRRHARVNGASGMRDYLKRQMERVGKASVKGVLVTVSIRENAITLEGTPSESTLKTLFHDGASFVRYVPESYAIDRFALNKYVRDGHAPPDGMRIADTTTYITIR